MATSSSINFTNSPGERLKYPLTGPATEQKHDLSEAMFLVDGFGYLTALSWLDLGGRLGYSERNHIEHGFKC